MLKSDKEIWIDSKCADVKVDFLTTHKELHLYASAIYSAMMWGMKLNEEHRKKKEPVQALP